MQDSPYHIHKNQRKGLLVMLALLLLVLAGKYALGYYRPNGDTTLADSLFISQADSIEANLLADTISVPRKNILESTVKQEKKVSDTLVKRAVIRSQFKDQLPQDQW